MKPENCKEVNKIYHIEEGVTSEKFNQGGVLPRPGCIAERYYARAAVFPAREGYINYDFTANSRAK